MRAPGCPAAIVARRSCSLIAEREMRLWQDLLANSVQWWDNRADKRISHLPDFRHKTIKEPLWVTSMLKPSWVDACLLAPDALKHASPSYPQFYLQGDLDKALHMVLCSEDHSSSHDLYWSLARACYENTSLIHSKQLFHHLASLKFEACSLLAEYLVGIFAKCGDINAAISAFHVLPYRGTFSWTALIFVHVDCGQPKVALELYQLMLDEKVDPNERTFVALLQACGGAIELVKGREIHRAAQSAGMATNVFVGCTLISMYGKCGSIMEALETFSKMPRHSVVSWTALLSVFLEQGKQRETLQLYRLMLDERVSPNDRTIVVALQACGELIRKGILVSGSLEIGRALHSCAKRRGYLSDAFVRSSLISMYGKSGKISEAESIFVTGMDQQNIVLWNAMLSAYLECCLEIIVLQIFAWLIKHKLSLNKRTYAIVIQASCMLAEKEEAVMINRQPTKPKSSDIVQVIHSDARCKKFDEDMFVGSVLVCAHGKCGNVVEAESVFFGLQGVDAVAWTGLLFMYLEVGEANTALKVYLQMQERGLTLDDIILVCGLQACADTGNIHVCKHIHFIISCTSFTPCAPLALNLIHAYGDSMSVISACAIFDELLCPSVVQWTALMDGYAMEGNYLKSLHLFEEMKQAGLNPDEVSFLLALSACGHTGLVEKGVEYFESMNRDYGVSPDLKHYVSVANLLGRMGDFVKLESLFARIAVEPSMALWLCLLDACRVYGNVKVAKWAFDQAVTLDPEESAAYATMLSIYANAGLWDLVDDVDNSRRNRGAAVEGSIDIDQGK